jgi:hypothetical protein
MKRTFIKILRTTPNGKPISKKYYYQYPKTRVVDPYSFFPDPDPDPGVDVGDQYGSGSRSGSGSNTIRIRGFNDQKLKKNYS